MKLNRQELDDYLIEYEKDNPVEFWHYKDLDLWPILKIMTSLRARDLISELKKDGFRKRNDGLKKENSMKFILNHINRFFSALYFISFNWRRKASPFFLFASNGFRVEDNGQLVNPFFKPIIDYSKEHWNYDPFMFEFDSISVGKEDKKVITDRIINVNHFIPIFRLLRAITPNFSGDDKFFHFIKEIKIRYPDFVDIQEYLLDTINRIYISSKVYSLLFKLYKPKYAICLTFYCNNMFAMILAAHRNGVKTIDLAHGYNSKKTCIVYSRHSKSTANGFSSLPDFFWVWDEHVKSTREQVYGLSVTHKLFVGGNPKIYYYQNSSNQIKELPKKVILLTLTTFFPDVRVLETMKITNNEYDWWIRLHPSRKKQAMLLNNFLIENGISDSFNIEDANNKSIFEILKICSVHISYDSTAILDSVLFGNCPILLSKISEDSYPHFINSGKAIMAYDYSPQMINETIKAVEKKKSDLQVVEPLFKQVIDRIMDNTL
jgi:hypothetical protein